MKIKQKWLRILLICLCIWLAVTTVDLIRVVAMREKPIFAVCLSGADDGGSGTYFGLLYHFSIRGNFMPEDAPPHVTSYAWHLLGIEIFSLLEIEPNTAK